MGLWDTADLLRRAKKLARRPAVDPSIGDPAWYDWFTEAQAEVYPAIFSRFPDMAYSAPVLMLSEDGGFTYIYGRDADGDLIMPYGHTELYPTLRSIPDAPLVPGFDFMFEAGKIRFPSGRSRSYSDGGPYARFVADPDVAISAAQNPLLQPKSARMLLVYLALEKWASRRGSGANPAYYRTLYDGNDPNTPGGRLGVEIMRLASAYNMQGAQAAGGMSDRAWWFATGDVGTGDGGRQFDPSQYA